MKLPQALAEPGLTDEYEFIAHPRIAAWPDIVRGVSKPVDLRLVSRLEFGAGALAMRCGPKRFVRAPGR